MSGFPRVGVLGAVGGGQGPTKGCKAIKAENRGDTAHIDDMLIRCNEAQEHKVHYQFTQFTKISY